MAILVDTSVLGRLANRADAAHPVATRAVAELHRRGEVLHLTPQNLIEFRAFNRSTVAASEGLSHWRPRRRERAPSRLGGGAGPGGRFSGRPNASPNALYAAHS